MIASDINQCSENIILSDNHISVHVRYDDPKAVSAAVSEIFTGVGYGLLSDETAKEAVESEEELEDDIYGFIVSGATSGGWISVYVDDWVDSGLIAKTLSQKLAAWVLETWINDEVHWGYTLYNEGEILDRFADDPYEITNDPNEAALYTGQQETFGPILINPSPDSLKSLLDKAQENAGEEHSAKFVAQLAELVGIPFEHTLIGLEDFFEEDPEDYVQDLENWDAFRFLTFRHPEGRSTLS